MNKTDKGKPIIIINKAGKGAPKLARNLDQQKLATLEAYLKKHYHIRLCEITGNLFARQKGASATEWKQQKGDCPDILRDIRANLEYATQRGSSSSWTAQYLQQTIIAEENHIKYNPYKEYLAKLKSKVSNKEDAMEGIRKVFDLLVLSDPSEHERAFTYFLKWGVGVVKSIKEPGYMNKQVLTIRSTSEGIGKTSFLHGIIPRAFRIQQLHDIDGKNKDSYLALAKYPIGLLDEIDLFLSRPQNRAQFKAFIAQKEVNLRRPYDKNETEAGRIMSFVATCNNLEFIGQVTGRSRFAVISIGAIKNDDYCTEHNITNIMPAEQIDVDKLWGSFLALYGYGYECDYTREEKQANMEANKRYEYVDELTDLVRDKLQVGEKSQKEALFMRPLQVKEYLEEQCQHQKSMIAITSTKLGRVLNSEGFEKTKRRENGAIVWGYWVIKRDAVHTSFGSPEASGQQASRPSNSETQQQELTWKSKDGFVKYTTTKQK